MDSKASRTGGDGRIAFEVSVGAETSCAIEMLIVADNWIEAWQLALEELGHWASPADVMCGIYPGDKIVVDVKTTGHKLVVRSKGRLVKPAQRATESARRPWRKPKLRTLPSLGGSVEGTIPSVFELASDPGEATRQLLDMLQTHVQAASIQYLAPDGQGRLSVVAARGSSADDLVDRHLSTDQPLVAMALDNALRLQIHGAGTQLEYQLETRPALTYCARTLCCAPVKGGGAFLLLESGRTGGFSEGELGALVYVAELVGRRQAS